MYLFIAAEVHVVELQLSEIHDNISLEVTVFCA
jgi:hypothetical protein